MMTYDEGDRVVPRRIYLWATARSLGTVFLKCLTQIPESQVINGLFTSCYFFGSETPFKLRGKLIVMPKDTELSEFTLAYDGATSTYDWAKSQFELDYPGKKYIICKDAPISLQGRHELIPKGFRHTFMIRHPHRMFSSWKGLLAQNIGSDSLAESSLKDIINNNFNGSFEYKELYDILVFLQCHPELGDPNPVVFDVDDLLNSPKSVLEQYFQAINIPFTEDYLHWQPGIDQVQHWKVSRQLIGRGLRSGNLGYFNKAIMETSGFLPPKKLPTRDELDADVLELVDVVMPYYEKLYNMRTIKP